MKNYNNDGFNWQKIGNTLIRPLEAYEIAAKLIYLNQEERDEAINKTAEMEYIWADGTKTFRRQAIRTWLKGYDNNEAGDVVGFLQRKHKVRSL